ncbi:ATP phosphoribosyltransferase regulatory subunit [Candidatus Oscillochloris fontis]|uniref:ATP phosphoribosyltransferase regulatory subunit n=1 Tax=Candidatus Oscillochloris fontis TaxID=2496868 RepID=UPI00101CAF4E|nr:ATP phosphoribosyltransferase regulatory subunit [Candidatus Oscillochloris fontis]
MSSPIEAVRGMHDVLPDEQCRLVQVRRSLEQTLDRHGYRMIDLPVLEQRELYLRKLGEELVGKVYEFNFGERHLALRPEWTASVLRAYIAHMQGQPLPLRLAYAGPVFRYEQPQVGATRQFTQVGVELVGCAAPRADAEVLALACTGLEAAGLHNYRLVVGHIGMIREVLAGLGLEERTQGILAWSMERLRSEGLAAVRERISETISTPPDDMALPSGLDDEQAAAWLLRMLDAMQIDLSTGTRSPHEVIQRLLRKLRRGDPQPTIDRALELLARLVELHGPPVEVLPQISTLLAEYALTSPAANELETILTLLAAHGIDQQRVEIDLGLGRGLHYYTGLIFEIYTADGQHLGGGGRYDDLVQTLGGSAPTPAVGFSYVLECVARGATLPPPAQPALVLVAAEEAITYPLAIEVAHQLRQQGLVAIMDVGVPGTATPETARQHGATHLALVGDSGLVWHDLKTGQQQQMRMTELDTLV